MAQLVAIPRAIEMLENFPSSDTQIMTDCVNAASDVVVKYCNQNFIVQNYDDLCDGQGTPNLLLDNYPIISIARINYLPTQVLQIRQTNPIVSRASFRLEGDNSQPPQPTTLYLVRLMNGIETDIHINLQSGVTSVDGVTGQTFPMITLGDLASCINSFNSLGWYGLALGIFNTWPIQDLRPPQGSFECRWYGSAYLELHAYSLPWFEINPSAGEIVCPQGFDKGYRNFRAIYTAGHSCVPESVQQAVVAIAVSVYLSRGINMNMISENLGGYSYTLAAERSFKQLDVVSRFGLNLYRNYRLPKFKVY